MKHDNNLSVSLSGSKRRSWDAQTQAMLLHRGIKLIRDRAFEQLEKSGLFDQINQEIESFFKQKNPDKEVLHHLQMIFRKERPISEREKLDHIAQETISQYIEQQSVLKEHHMPLTLSDSGDLYREPKEAFCYPMRNAKRLKLLRALIDCRAFYNSKKLQAAVNYDDKTMADAIQQINRLAQRKLGLPGGKESRLIDSRPHSGYRINPLYPIKQES